MTEAAVLDPMECNASSGASAVSARTHGVWPWVLAGVAMVGLVIGITIIDRAPIGAQKDDAVYVILAKSLATGQGYRSLNLPGTPDAIHFPPGYPAALAVLWRIVPRFPANIVLFKLFNALCLAVIGVGVARMMRRGVAGAGWAAGAALMTIASVPLLILGNMLVSELFSLAILLFLLPALDEFVMPDANVGASQLRAVTLGVAIGVSILVRTQAIVLLPAAALLLFLSRRWRAAVIVCIATIVCVAPWRVWSSLHGGALPEALLGEYGSYTDWWLRGLHTIGPSMITYTLHRTVTESGQMFAVLFSPARGALAHAVTLLALVGIGAVGAHAIWPRARVTLLFLAGYLVIVALWPFPPTRFLWGIWPLFLVLLLCGARVIVLALGGVSQRASSVRVGAIVGAAAVLWIGVGYGKYEMRAVRGQWWASIPRQNAARILTAVRWTLANTAPSDIVATEDDGAVYLYTGRPTLPVRNFTVEQYLTVPTARDDAEQGLLPLLDRYRVRAVIVGSANTLAAAEFIAAPPVSRLALWGELPGGAVFSVPGP